jgi:hypothetical protein
MRIRRIAISAAFATWLAALPFSAANAQYYAPCSPSPLAWPFCVAGAIVGAAATIATAPFWVLAGMPPYGYYLPPYYPAPSYYASGFYAPPYSTYASPSAAAPQAAPATPVPPHPATDPGVSDAPPPAQDAYFFCPASKGYYPYVARCAVAWRRVPMTPPDVAQRYATRAAPSR